MVLQFAHMVASKQHSINVQRYVWQFIVADVTQPLLGADFLCSNTLMVDVKGQRLVDPTTYTSSSTAEESLTPVATELAEFNINNHSNNQTNIHWPPVQWYILYMWRQLQLVIMLCIS